jgi:hypothetical protein
MILWRIHLVWVDHWPDSSDIGLPPRRSRWVTWMMMRIRFFGIGSSSELAVLWSWIRGVELFVVFPSGEHQMFLSGSSGFVGWVYRGNATALCDSWSLWPCVTGSMFGLFRVTLLRKGDNADAFLHRPQRSHTLGGCALDGRMLSAVSILSLRW